MNEEQIILANAYLDGELTDEERRIAEADPAVMAEVDELRALQRRLRDVDPPSIDARESAIAAAMAEFQGADAAATTPATTPAAEPVVVPYRPRPAYGRYLAIAAAVAAVGVLGVVIVNSPAGDDDDSAFEAPVDDAADEPMATATADDGADAETSFAEEAIEEFDEPADQPAEEPADEPASADLDAPAAEAADDLADGDAADEAADDAGTVPTDGSRLLELPGGTPDLPITTEDELLEYGEQAIALSELGLLPPSPESSCELQVITTASLLFDGLVSEVFVAIDPLDPLPATVWAIDPDSCDELLVATRIP